MRLPRSLALATGLLAGLPLLAADPPDPLPPHGWGGGVFHSRMTAKTDQHLRIQQQDLTQRQETVFYHRWTELPPDRAGNPRLRQRVEGAKLRIDIGGNVIEYDSTRGANNPGANAGLADFFAALVGTEFTVTLDARTGEVLRVDGKEEFVRRLKKGDAQMAQLLDRILSDDGLKQMCDPSCGVWVPVGAREGDRWERTQRLNLGPIGGYRTRHRVTHEGPDPDRPRLARLKVETDLRYVPPAEDQAGGAPFRIKGGELKADPERSVGLVLYDPAARRPVRVELPVRLSGTLVVVVGGADTNVELTQDQTTVTEFAAKSFLP